MCYSLSTQVIPGSDGIPLVETSNPGTYILKLIKRLSTSFNAKITLLRHISPDDSPEEIREASRYLSEIEGRSQIGCEKRFLEGYNDFQLIVNVSQHYDLLVLSDTAKKSWKNLFGHSRADHLCEEVFCSTLMLKFSKFQQPIEAPEEKRVKLHPLGS